jgi:DNA-binding CsgD family transcriptional regulator
MNAPTLKLRSGALLRAAPAGFDAPGPELCPAPNADLVRLEPVEASGCSGPPPSSRCLGPEVAGGPPSEPAEPPAPPVSTSQAVCLDPGPEVAPHLLAAFASALEAVEGPAFLMRPDGQVEHANDAARAWFERGRVEAPLRPGEGPRAATSHEVLTAPVAFGARASGRPWQVAFVRPQPDREAERVARVAAASARWSLSARQHQVLQLVVEGLSVPTIAAVLGCVEKTVGSHLNAIFKKALVESRAELTAKVWMG